MERTTIDLNGSWIMSGFDKDGNKISVSATVPCTVHTALAENNMLIDGGDIFFGKNADKAMWIEEKEWMFERDFDFNLSEDVKKLEIEFKGLDTYCEISLNGEVLANCNNMHMVHTFDVIDRIKNGKNNLKVKFFPPAVTDKKFVQRDYSGAFSNGRFYTRRMQCTYGWDWVNRFVTMGIFDSVSLYVNRFVKIDCLKATVEGIVSDCAVMELYVKGSHDKKFFDGAFKERGYHFETSPMVCFKVCDPDGREIYRKEMLFREEVTTDYVTIENPKLWFPAGYGESPVYTLSAEVRGDDGSVIDEKTILFGIREICIAEKPDKKDSRAYKIAKNMFERLSRKEEGENEFASFDLYINGVRIICKGANWVPANPFPGNVSAEKYQNLVKLAKDGNINMLRVWGGGIFESEDFYNMCDRCGIMVQQDFLMACGSYPYWDENIDDPTEDERLFVENLRAETEMNIQRLVSHPSLVWWNGDNENQTVGNPNLINNARRLANEVAAPILRKYDGKRRFFPSSPWGGVYNNSPSRGLFHGTGYLDLYFDFIKNTDMTGYVEAFGGIMARFANETPILSCPTESSVKRFLPESEITTDSFDGYIYHTKNHPDEKYKDFGLFHHMDTGARKLFGEFKDGSDRVYKMGVLGYEWLRASMEGMRRKSDYTSGLVFWMFNDCWPALGWSIVDYYGTPKAAYYAMKRTAAPLSASVTYEESGVAVYISNNDRKEKSVNVKLSLVTGDGIEFSENMQTTVAANEVVRVVPKNADKFDLKAEEEVIVCDISDGKESDRAFYSAVVPSKLNLPKAKVEAIRNNDTVILKSDKLAMFVWIDGDYILSDNCIILLPGEEKEVTVKENYDHKDDEIKLHWINN